MPGAAVTVLSTSVDPSSEAFLANDGAYRRSLETLEERLRWSIDGDRAAAIDRHLRRGKLMVRDRIDLVVDPGSPFLELSTLAGWGQYDDEAPGAGMVTGVGIVEGRPFVFVANDATVKGGSLLPASVKKHIRAQKIADENDLGCIYLVDSGGAFLPLQDEIFPDKEKAGGSSPPAPTRETLME